MKRSAIITALILAFLTAATFALIACKLDNDEQKDSSETSKVEEWTFSAYDLEEAKDIYEDFFYVTLNADNYLVTVSNGNGGN